MSELTQRRIAEGVERIARAIEPLAEDLQDQYVKKADVRRRLERIQNALANNLTDSAATLTIDAIQELCEETIE